MSYWSIISRATGHWPLQDDASDTTVVAVAGPAGSLAGGSTSDLLSTVGPTSWLPKALSLNGSTQHVSTGMTDGAWSGGTVAVWARPLSTQTAYSGLVVRRAMLSAYAYSDNRLRYNWSAQPAEYGYVGAAYPINQWTHLAVRVRADRVDFFVNGVLAGGNALAHPIVSQTAPVYLGFDPIDPARHFHGDLAGAMVFPEALADAEVSRLYAGPEPTLNQPPALLSPPTVSRSLHLAEGSWDSHDNGDPQFSWTVQWSDDGLSGWQDLPGSSDPNAFVVPTSLESKSIRLAVVASNNGGASDPVYTDAALVQSPAWPGYLLIGSARSGGLAESAAFPTGRLEAGAVLPREA